MGEGFSHGWETGGLILFGPRPNFFLMTEKNQVISDRMPENIG